MGANEGGEAGELPRGGRAEGVLHQVCMGSNPGTQMNLARVRTPPQPLSPAL